MVAPDSRPRRTVTVWIFGVSYECSLLVVSTYIPVTRLRLRFDLGSSNLPFLLSFVACSTRQILVRCSARHAKHVRQKAHLHQLSTWWQGGKFPTSTPIRSTEIYDRFLQDPISTIVKGHLLFIHDLVYQIYVYISN